jgi:hypothetical protein
MLKYSARHGGATVATYGNATPYGEMSSHAPSFLLGSKLALAVPAQLTHLAVITHDAGPMVQLALYTDAGNTPGALMASTAATTMVLGTMELPVAQTALPAGDYWIMGNYSASTSIGIDFSDANALVAYVTLSFGAALPDPFGAPQTYTGQKFNYYIKVLQ